MGSDSLLFLDWRWECFRKEKHIKYKCLCCFLMSWWNAFSINQTAIGHYYPKYLSTLLRALLHLSRTTFLEAAVSLHVCIPCQFNIPWWVLITWHQISLQLLLQSLQSLPRPPGFIQTFFWLNKPLKMSSLTLLETKQNNKFKFI